MNVSEYDYVLLAYWSPGGAPKFEGSRRESGGGEN